MSVENRYNEILSQIYSDTETIGKIIDYVLNRFDRQKLIEYSNFIKDAIDFGKNDLARIDITYLEGVIKNLIPIIERDLNLIDIVEEGDFILKNNYFALHS
jgi:hypothetical protein